jgi:hypothetical protein
MQGILKEIINEIKLILEIKSFRIFLKLFLLIYLFIKNIIILYL